MNNKIEIRCKRANCNRLFMNYYLTGNDVDLHLEGFELKCEKKGSEIKALYRADINGAVKRRSVPDIDTNNN